MASYREKNRKENYLEVVKFARADAEAVRAHKNSRTSARTLNSTRVTVPNLKELGSWRPSTMLAGSVADKMESGHISDNVYGD